MMQFDKKGLAVSALTEKQGETRGFVGTAIAGFLLTAVPSWTGARGFAGRRFIEVQKIGKAGKRAHGG